MMLGFSVHTEVHSSQGRSDIKSLEYLAGESHPLKLRIQAKP